MKYAPIVISVYDRLKHITECVDSLKANKEAIHTDIFIAVDFPSKKEDEEKINKVLDFAKNIKGFKNCYVLERNKNLGPGKNMRAALNEVFSKYDRLIAMEDDNVVSEDFLEYMNNALEFYENDERIISISGYNFPLTVPKEYKNDVYIWQAYNGYGIGAWKHKNFKKYYESLHNFEKFINDDELIERFMSIAEHILPILFDGMSKGVLYGDAAISYNYFMLNKYSLYPVVTKVKNIGYDGSGENCGTSEKFALQELPKASGKVKFIKNIQPEQSIFKTLFDYFKTSSEAKKHVYELVKIYRKEINKLVKTDERVISPLSGNSDLTKIREIPVEFIKRLYAQFNIDVSKYFSGLKTVSFYRCNRSGFMFFYPFNIAGDGEFYAKLQEIPWYYMDEKWEFNEALDILNENERVLEIGSGKGAFLRRAKEKKISIYGAELNQSQAEKLRSEGFTIYSEDLSELVKNNAGNFDVVCSFQVLEHVTNPKEFIETALKLLGKGGRLIVSVPNHDSFLGVDDENFLDMPPHHMSWWDEKSLIKLDEFFPMELKSLKLESLQKYHVDYYKSVFEKNYDDEYNIKEIIFDYVANNHLKVKGHTIMAEYEKL